MSDKTEFSLEPLETSVFKGEITPAVISSPEFAGKYEQLLMTLAQLEDLKKNVNEAIKLAMKDKYLATGDTRLTSGDINYVYVPESTRESLDTKRIKRELPEVYKDYVKISQISDHVRVSKASKTPKGVEFVEYDDV